MDDKLKSNLTSGEHWTRFIYMLLFAVFLYIATILAMLIVGVQFLFALVTGGPNSRLRQFGGETVSYINQVWLFLSYNSEVKAFPFSDWPVIEEVFESDSEAIDPEVPAGAAVRGASDSGSNPEASDSSALASEQSSTAADKVADHSHMPDRTQATATQPETKYDGDTTDAGTAAEASGKHRS